jgi:hypothetical protein
MSGSAPWLDRTLRQILVTGIKGVCSRPMGRIDG